MAKIKIAIDAGHGSTTAGKRTPPFTKDVDINGDKKIDIKKGSQYNEHSANVGVASLLYKKLAARGYSLIKTGWEDDNTSNDSDEALSSRQGKIKKAKCDYSVSIHFNAYGDGSAFNSVTGVCVYIHSQYFADSGQLADYALQELSKGTPQKNRGIHTASLAMCNCNTMKTKASILCELAFMTNEFEAQQLMANSRFWDECATEIANAIDRYCKCNNYTEVSSGSIKLYHKVAKGETLSKIAAEHKISIDKLIKLNKIKNPDKISVGQKLLLYQYKKYTVQKGDTLSEISLKFFKDIKYVDDIMVLNNLESSIIYVNQVLKIPVL